MLVLAKAVEDFIHTHEAEVRQMLKHPEWETYICRDGTIVERVRTGDRDAG